jgi:hypothetical protein
LAIANNDCEAMLLISVVILIILPAVAFAQQGTDLT